MKLVIKLKKEFLKKSFLQYFWIGGLNFDDDRYKFKFEGLCPENQTAELITCDCAINTSEPCMAYCFECVRS